MRTDYLRKRMIEMQLKARGISSLSVIRAMSRVERHCFVPDHFRHLAYSDSPLSIGSNQTISQPYIVAFMIEKLDLNDSHSVLEIGTGSGYQTALLAEIAKEVYTVERIQSLGLGAKEILNQLGYNNIRFKIGDGTLGWQGQTEKTLTFDRIIVAAGAPEIPHSLLEQIADGGKLIIPAGNRIQQELIMIERFGEEFRTSNHGPCSFVPLIGKEGWDN